MGWIILAAFSFCAGMAWCYYWEVQPLKKKVKELQKRIMSNGIKGS
jgi:hypothetical protein